MGNDEQVKDTCAACLVLTWLRLTTMARILMVVRRSCGRKLAETWSLSCRRTRDSWGARRARLVSLLHRHETHFTLLERVDRAHRMELGVPGLTWLAHLAHLAHFWAGVRRMAIS
jgi:hypothetical protein